jgi:hypothetical protein
MLTFSGLDGVICHKIELSSIVDLYFVGTKFTVSEEVTLGVAHKGICNSQRIYGVT